MNKKQKKVLVRIIVSIVLLIALAIVTRMVELKHWIELVLYMIPYLVIGYDILKKAVKGIMNRQVFDENFLMAVATVGAVALGDYKEGVAVMLFYQIGELFQSYAVGKSRRNISDLMDIRPDYANIERDGQLEKVDPDEVEIGSIIVVQPGEKVPIDGIIVEGKTTLNTSALTGESVPRSATTGEEVISGCINLSGLIKIQTTKEFGESTVSKILDLVENASSKKSRSENFISKFAHYYTGSLLRCACTGNPAADHQPAYGQSCTVGNMDLPCTDIPCNQLPMCIGYQYSAQLLRRNRRRKLAGCPDQGLELHGDSGTDEDRCI